MLAVLSWPLPQHQGQRCCRWIGEHSAIFQCLQGHGTDLEKIILTGSGGPFRTRTDLESVTVEEALKHPNWDMGAKITIDSATLMNKALEVIEAYHLFAVPMDQIEVLIHPESVIHSMVAYGDGSVMAQLGEPDMRTPIQYALTWPNHVSGPVPTPDFTTMNGLHFEKPRRRSLPQSPDGTGSCPGRRTGSLCFQRR